MGVWAFPTVLSPRKEISVQIISLDTWKEDGDWQCAFNEAAGEGYSFDRPEGDLGQIANVAAVIACAEGMHDGPDWLCIGEWADGRFFKMFAGCDYTGWD
jgi:hypothetical protein